MPHEESPESAAESFAALSPPCPCNLGPRPDDVNRAIQRFHELKTSGETRQAWDAFCRHVLAAQYGYPRAPRTLRDHKRNCLGLT